MEYLFIQRQGDREQIIDLLSEFNRNSKNELVCIYNRTVEIGIVGAHAQAQRLVALHHAFKASFGKSPIKLEDNTIGLTGKIELSEGNWMYQSTFNF
jgi:hypothetical protein